MSTTAVLAPPDTRRGSAAERRKARRPGWADDWPHTTRLMPWLIAVFMATVFLVPIDGTEFNVKLPVDSRPDRFLLVAMAAALLLQSLVTPRRRRPVVRMTATTGAVLVFAAVAMASVLPNAGRIFRLGELSLVEKQLSALLAYIGFFLIVATQVRRSEIRAYGRFVLILAVLTSLGVLYESRSGYNVFYDWTRMVLGPVAHVIQAPTNIHPGIDEGRKTVVGPTQHGLALAAMLTVALPFAVIRLFEVKRLSTRLIYLVAIALIFGASLSTGRKTAIVAPIGAVFVLAFYYRQMLKWLPVAVIVLLPVIHVAAPGALGTFNILATGGSSISTQGRESDYAAVKPDILANPILGRGVGSLDPDNPRWYRVLDNEYLGELFGVGFLGLAAYLAMVLAPLFTAHRVIRRDPRRAPPMVAAAAGCAAYAIVSGTFDAMSFPQAPYAFLFSAGLIAAAASRQLADRTAAVPPRATQRRPVREPRKSYALAGLAINVREELVPSALAMAGAVRDGLVTGARAVATGLVVMAVATRRGLVTAARTLATGLVALGAGLVAMAAATRRGVVTAARTLGAGLVAMAAATRRGVVTAARTLATGLVALGAGLVAMAAATRRGVVTAARTLATGLVAMAATTRRGVVTAGRTLATGLVALGAGLVAMAAATRRGVVTAARTLATGLVALGAGLVAMAAATRRGLVTGVRGLASGLLTLVDAIRHGVVTAAQAVGTGLLAVGTGLLAVGTGLLALGAGLLAAARRRLAAVLRALANAVRAVARFIRDLVIAIPVRLAAAVRVVAVGIAAGVSTVANGTRSVTTSARGRATGRDRRIGGVRQPPAGRRLPEPAQVEVGGTDLSVIVVTHNGEQLALTTLRSAKAAAAGLDVQWIVVDSGSSDGTPDSIRRDHPDVTVIEADNRGCAAGNNKGLDLATGRYVLLLNPDVEIAEGTLKGLVQAMDDRPTVGIASVLQRGTGGELQPSIRRFPSVRRDLGESLFAFRWPLLRTWQELETRAKAYQRETSADWLVGAFLIARAEAIKQVGPMDTAFFLYSEEVDWCYRFTQQGWDVRHIPVMTIVHHAGRRDRGDLMAQLAYSRGRFATKHYGAGRGTAIRMVLALGHGIRILALIPQCGHHEARARLKAERRALAVQLGLAAPPYLGSEHADERARSEDADDRARSEDADDRPDPPRQRALLLDAVHVFGVETLEEGDEDIELWLADFGIDVRKPSTGETIGRVRWDELRSVAVTRPRRGPHGLERPALFVLGIDQAEVIFELPGMSNEEITEHLEPLIARNSGGGSGSNAG